MENYSVLMSVYNKEKPEYLKQSMESMFNQTVVTDDFVLVCDGPLTKELDRVITYMEQKYRNILHVVRLEKNGGLGNALNVGIKHCKNDLVARMDSDDVSKPFRCELQMQEFKKDNELAICSGEIEEFVETIDEIMGKRELPCRHDEICVFSKKRSPFNHPAVMFKKKVVERAGGYNERFHLFEDYYLWIRILMDGNKAINIDKSLLFMRTPEDMYKRRGGAQYAKDMLRFHSWMVRVGWSSIFDFMTGALPHAVICVLPNLVRKGIYNKLH